MDLFGDIDFDKGEGVSNAGVLNVPRTKRKGIEFSYDKETKKGKIIKKGYISKLMKSLHNNKSSCDSIVKFPKRDYYVHSIVLFQNGSFFKKLYEKKQYTFKDGKMVFDKSVLGFDITTEEFGDIITFMYLGHFGAPKPGKELRWLEIAHHFELVGIREVVLYYFGTYLTPGDAVRIIDKCRENNDKFLFRACVTLIESLDDVVFIRTEEYMNFHPDTILHFVREGRMSIDELDFFKCIVKYCKKKYKESGFKSAEEMYKQKYGKFIRYGLIKADDFCLEVEKKYPFWIKSDYVLEAYKFNSDPSIKKTMDSIRIKERGTPPGRKFKGSTILNSKQQKKLFGWFKEQPGVKQGKFSLIFDAKKDGMNGTSFHSKCNNKGATMIVIESIDNCIFGGYTSTPWTSTSRYHVDKTAFLFVIKRGSDEEGYKMDNKPSATHHVYHHSSYGPTFGGNHDLYVPNNFSTTTGYSNVGHSYLRASGKSNYLTISNSFKVKNLEVFQLL